MFRVSIFISLFICSAYSATTTTEVKQPVTGGNSLWTDISLKEPSALIKVEYKNNGKVTNVAPGTVVEKIITGPAPKLVWQLEKNAKYTVAMIDPDAPSRKEPTKRSVSVPTMSPLVLSANRATGFDSSILRFIYFI